MRVELVFYPSLLLTGDLVFRDSRGHFADMSWQLVRHRKPRPCVAGGPEQHGLISEGQIDPNTMVLHTRVFSCENELVQIAPQDGHRPPERQNRKNLVGSPATSEGPRTFCERW
jgi:hypothetical protein